MNLMLKLQNKIKGQLYYSDCFSDPGCFQKKWIQIQETLDRSLWYQMPIIAASEQAFAAVPEDKIKNLEQRIVDQIKVGRNQEAEQLIHS